SGQAAVTEGSREPSTGLQTRPQPDHLVLPREAGELPQRECGVDHWQPRPRLVPFDLSGDVLRAAESLVAQAASKRLGRARAEVAARDRASSRRPVEREDELLAVAVLEVAVVQPGVIGVAQARRGGAPHRSWCVLYAAKTSAVSSGSWSSRL